MKLIPIFNRLTLLGVILFAFSGCEVEEKKIADKKPRPVELAVLSKQTPPGRALVPAVVASWKTEKVGAEVAGSVKWIVENNSDIQGRIRDDDGTLIMEGTPIAQIDTERYDLQKEAAEAEVARAKNAIEAVEIEIANTIPSQMRAAEAVQKRAKIEYDRSVKLFKIGAASGSDVDRDEANYAEVQEKIKQLESLLAAKRTDQESRQSNLLKAKKALRAAERSVEDGTLYSSFSGQISQTLAVPGSIVAAGQPIAVLQMMDPIKVELEVSPDVSRQLQDRQRLSVLLKQASGSTLELDGMLYQIDSVADPKQRTFTVTILIANKRLVTELDEKQDIATTEQTWRLDFQFFEGAETGKHYAPIEAIHTDAEGEFVWKINNLTAHDSLPEDRILQVEKMRVTTRQKNLSFLGNWVFDEVEFQDTSFDPTTNLIAGKLQVCVGEPEDWNGTELFIEKSKGQWLLRPGDVVQVDLSESNLQSGYFVPMDAIARQNGKNVLFLIDESASETVVRANEIKVMKTDSHISSLVRIESVDPGVDLDGKRFVTKGTHFLRDEQPVRLVYSEDGE